MQKCRNSKTIQQLFIRYIKYIYSIRQHQQISIYLFEQQRPFILLFVPVFSSHIYQLTNYSLSGNKKKMLTQDVARGLGFKGSFHSYKIQDVSFKRNGRLWLKTKTNPLPFKMPNKTAKFPYYKLGKTFGLQTIRYVSQVDGILMYFQKQSDTECKGYLYLQNTYMYYFMGGSHYVMCLSNGEQFSVLHFTDCNFVKNIGTTLLKNVIQLNFKDKYRIIEEIGQGTFSKVYLAENRNTKKQVAVKVVPKVDSTGFITKGIVEEQKKILKYLKYPLICQMYEFFEDTGNYIFALEYISGKDLSKIMKQTKQMSLNENIFILKQILLSLQQIHRHSIIHRDLKPHNIVVNIKQKSVKLIDFGLSLVYDNKTELHKFMRCGTMGYIAPEVVNNGQAHRKRYDCRSDMFGFGIIAYMLLTGVNPLRGKTYKDTVQNNIKCDIKVDKKLIMVRYGKSCYDLLQSLLQKDPNLRPTATQALTSKFLDEKYKDEQSVMMFEDDTVHEHKNDEINYIEDKQLAASKIKLSKLASYDSVNENQDINSPHKFLSVSKTLPSWHSSSKLSGLA